MTEKCQETTKRGGPCGRKAHTSPADDKQHPDGDGVYRCIAHSKQASARESRANQGAAGRVGGAAHAQVKALERSSGLTPPMSPNADEPAGAGMFAAIKAGMAEVFEHWPEFKVAPKNHEELLERQNLLLPAYLTGLIHPSTAAAVTQMLKEQRRTIEAMEIVAEHQLALSEFVLDDGSGSDFVIDADAEEALEVVT